MNRVDLTYRLRQMGMRKPQFAERLGMKSDTVYQWDEIPQYAAVCVELMEEVARLTEENRKLRLRAVGVQVEQQERKQDGRGRKPNAGHFKKGGVK